MKPRVRKEIRRKVRCPGCKRLMTQLAPKNRDLLGKSWHRTCLVDAVTQGLRDRSEAKHREDGMKCYEFTFTTGNRLTAHGTDIPDMLLGLYQDDPYFEYRGILTGVVSLREGYAMVGEDESTIVSFTGDEVRQIAGLAHIGI